MTRWLVSFVLTALLLASLSSSAVAQQRLLLRHAAASGKSRHLQGETNDEFIDQCTTNLLSDDTIDDDLISQEEFSQFLSNLCVTLQVCEEGTSLEFENLSVELQLSFVLFLCNEPTESEREECLDELKEMGSSFGYSVGAQDPAILQTEIQELCVNAYDHAMESGLLPPTLTDVPTEAPATTVAPTPSEAGSDNPSERPTQGGNGPNDGTGPVDGAGAPLNSNNDSLSTGLVVGVSVAGLVILLAAAFLVSRRRKKRRGVSQTNKYVAADIHVAGDESIFTEDSDAFQYIPKKMDSFHSAHSKASSSNKSLSSSSGGGRRLPLDMSATAGLKSRSVAQFDPSNAAAAIALGIDGNIIRRGSETSSNKSSPVMSLNAGRHGKMKNLTEAIDYGDWDAVANIAGNMVSDDSEEVSTISDYSSAREQLSHASQRSSVSSSLNSGDEIRAAQIQEMVERGDWSGVATAAQFFSSNRSLGSGGRSVGHSTAETPKRSFLDFVTGRRTAPSAAAIAAIVPNAPDLVERDSEMSEAGANVGVVEDVPSVAEAGQNDTMDTQSSSSRGTGRDGDVTSSEQKRKTRWFGRLMSSRASKRSAASHSDGRAGSSEALQLELNQALERGDWKTIEEISAKLDSPGTQSVSSQTAVRGSAEKSDPSDDALLGAASLASMKRPSKPKWPGESPIASQRKEIDAAVSRGDWNEVERLTTQLLNTKPSPVPKDAMSDTLMETPLPSKSSKSPFRDTPSSSDWSGSPMDKELRSEKLRKLISAKDWKGVHVLSGIYEMEAKGTLPPTFASMSNDSADNPAFAQGWLLGGNSNASTPPDSVDGSGHRPPASPSTSTSTNNSSELREFERLVNAKDWRGLASFAGAEQEIDDDDSDDGLLLPRNIFKIDPIAPQKSPPAGDSGEKEHVEHQETEGPLKRKQSGDSDVESLHGAPVLIPYWQKKVDKNSPDAEGGKK